jgi:hypothetical protein
VSGPPPVLTSMATLTHLCHNAIQRQRMSVDVFFFCGPERVRSIAPTETQRPSGQQRLKTAATTHNETGGRATWLDGTFTPEQRQKHAQARVRNEHQEKTNGKKAKPMPVIGQRHTRRTKVTHTPDQVELARTRHELGKQMRLACCATRRLACWPTSHAPKMPRARCTN